MRFRPARVQRLPRLDQVIAIFKKELETNDMLGALRPAGNVFEREHDCENPMSIFAQIESAECKDQINREGCPFLLPQQAYSRSPEAANLRSKNSAVAQ